VPVLPKPVFVVAPAPPPNKLPPVVLVEPKPDVALLLPKPVDAPKPVFVVVLLAVDPKPPNPVDALLLLELPKRLPPELLAGCPKAGFAAPKGDELEVDPKPGESGDVVSVVKVVIVGRIVGAEIGDAQIEAPSLGYLMSRC